MYSFTSFLTFGGWLGGPLENFVFFGQAKWSRCQSAMWWDERSPAHLRRRDDSRTCEARWCVRCEMTSVTVSKVCRHTMSVGVSVGCSWDVVVVVACSAPPPVDVADDVCACMTCSDDDVDDDRSMTDHDVVMTYDNFVISTPSLLTLDSNCGWLGCEVLVHDGCFVFFLSVSE